MHLRDLLFLQREFACSLLNLPVNTVHFVARPYLTCKYCMNTFVTQTNQDLQFSVFKTGDMEKPICLVYSITKGISQLTEADLDKTTSDLFQVTKQQVEQIAESVELHFDCGDNEHGLQPKRSCVSDPTDDDDDDDISDYESSDYFLEEPVTLDHANKSGFQKEYSSLTEDASNVGEGSLN